MNQSYQNKIRLIGIDPGLQRTGWGVIEVDGNHLRHIADGFVATDAKAAIGERLVRLHDGLEQAIRQWQPEEAAVEETFVNKNPASALKLGVARGVALLTPARLGLPVFEYPANLIKKSVVGSGHAEKHQIGAMIKVLLPGCVAASADSADALAVAICHAHHRMTKLVLGGIMSGGVR